MTTEQYVAHVVIPAAFTLLPQTPTMTSTAARAMLIAIGRQESQFKHRRQVGSYRAGVPTYGPARGWWQFETGGVLGVLEHDNSREAALEVLTALGYGTPSSRDVHEALQHNDILAAAFARLFLYTDARALPGADQSADGWLIYFGTWRPGKPHPQTWRGHFDAAWAHYTPAPGGPL